MIGRTVAICTNGTRVLGLGDIGPVASMPVMEGKAIFYTQFVGLDAMPILIDTRRPRRVRRDRHAHRAGASAAIHLEDISAPDCFEIEARADRGAAAARHARRRPRHRGRHARGRARRLPAGRRAGSRTPSSASSASAPPGFGIAALMRDARRPARDRVRPERGRARPRARARDRDRRPRDRDARGRRRRRDDRPARPDHAGDGPPRPGHPRADEPRSRRSSPTTALAAGAAFAADGTSVNNVLGYPGIFRGALTPARARSRRAMKLAAARAIAELTEESELVPDVLDRSVHEHVAEAVRAAAVAV